ncbi:HET domain-containing protein [Colletotrichum truncatum]|uniref:HET domain-containing protein n=1 Tax=Colletotrichum truncatum TaxID=5467 RepID=A0ACC3YRI5_COLTU|nr:HET domain-containing protein [Colletotrichum truncatum]KAF6799224.1 HET domain-containing protein [Colletotrichum truncatum]
MSSRRSALLRFTDALRHPRQILLRRSNGCSVCEFTGDENANITSKHSLETWTEAAKNCCFCELVVAVLNEVRRRHGIDISGGGQSQIYLCGGNPNNVGGRYYLVRDYFHHSTAHEDLSTQILFYNHFGSESPWEGLPYDEDISKTAGSKECLVLLKYWMEMCEASHESCSSEKAALLPTRVLDVSSSQPRLIIAETLSRRTGRFIALSHCWGTSQPLRTLKDNIGLHHEGIDLGTLPQTFQDAVAVTRHLGIQYIWIDSLCIVQDDALDWEREAARMGDIYGSAHLVLGASSAAGGAEGFLGRRAHHWESKVTVPSPDGSRGKCEIHCRPLLDHPMPNARAPSSRGPLETRGWTFQERVLAKRFVSFGKYELSWGCNSLWDCECGWVRTRRGTPGEDFELMLKNSISLYPKINEMPEADLYHEWRFAVASPYSFRNLTFSKDKLVALSAISRIFYEKLNDNFLAGLWEKQLPRDLSWYCHREWEELDLNKDFSVPSWSWASVKGGVSWSMATKGFRFEKTCRVIEASCTPTSAINPFGSVAGGHVTLHGKFTPATAEYHGYGSKLWKDQTRHYLLDKWPTSNFYSDVFLGTAAVKMNGEFINTAVRLLSANRNDNREETKYPVWCFMLGTYRSGQTQNAAVIILGQSVSQPGKFERVGFAELEFGYKPAEEFFQGWTDETVTIV